MIELARAKLPPELGERIEFAVGDASALPYPRRVFDLVAQLNVPVYLEEAARVLLPGGHLIVASSLGPATPYYTPERLLRRGCRLHGLDPLDTGTVGGATHFLARRSGR